MRYANPSGRLGPGTLDWPTPLAFSLKDGDSATWIGFGRFLASFKPLEIQKVQVTDSEADITLRMQPPLAGDCLFCMTYAEWDSGGAFWG